MVKIYRSPPPPPAYTRRRNHRFDTGPKGTGYQVPTVEHTDHRRHRHLGKGARYNENTIVAGGDERPRSRNRRRTRVGGSGGRGIMILHRARTDYTYVHDVHGGAKGFPCFS